MEKGREIKNTSVYVHIPFCTAKCPYCDFNSITIDPIPEKRYVTAVIKELSLILEREGLKRVTTLYFGGGTPTVFSTDSIASLIEEICRKLTPEKDMEITIETNPDTIDKGKLKELHSVGVNRLSLGAQSFNDKLLKTLGRTHSAKKSTGVYSYARKAGFENIAIDLIFAIPGQTIKEWQYSISETIRLRPEHISIYGLKIEKNTPFHKRLLSGALKPVPEKTEVEMYGMAIGLLEGAGYMRYEISNMSLVGYESRHNLNYWNGGNYIGLGSGAHSYLNYPDWGRRWWNEKNPRQYMELVEEDKSPIHGLEALTKDQTMLETIFISLRTLEGINKRRFKKRFNIDAKDALQWKRLEELALVKDAGGKITLTDKGVIFSDEVY